MQEIALCRGCGAKNRLGTPPEGQTPRCGRCREALPWLIHGGDAQPEALHGPVPVLLDLWAPWCGPCLAMAPVLDDLAGEMAGKLKIVKIDVDQNPLSAQRFNARSIPLLVLFKDGEIVERIVGLQTRRALAGIVERYL